MHVSYVPNALLFCLLACFECCYFVHALRVWPVVACGVAGHVCTPFHPHLLVLCELLDIHGRPVP
jgi:hypothetical protein